MGDEIVTAHAENNRLSDFPSEHHCPLLPALKTHQP
jgi:hypothetical protein